MPWFELAPVAREASRFDRDRRLESTAQRPWGTRVAHDLQLGAGLADHFVVDAVGVGRARDIRNVELHERSRAREIDRSVAIVVGVKEGIDDVPVVVDPVRERVQSVGKGNVDLDVGASTVEVSMFKTRCGVNGIDHNRARIVDAHVRGWVPGIWNGFRSNCTRQTQDFKRVIAGVVGPRFGLFSGYR